MDNETGLEKAKQAVGSHIQVLEALENEAPQQAKQGIRNAIQNSSRVQGVLERAEAPIIREGIRERLRKVKENTRQIGPPKQIPPER